MNIVQAILDMLSGNVMEKLGSLIGENEAKTQSAVGAAVPALLSGFSSLASDDQGAQKLADSLKKIDAGSLSNLGSMLSGGSAESLAGQGNSLLTSLLGNGTVAGLVTALMRFTGSSDKSAKNLISYLGPLVLGGLAKMLSGKPINAQSLMNFFSSQKANIASSIPSGLAMADIPGLDTARSTAAAETTHGSSAKAATTSSTSSMLPWLLGLVVLAGILAFLWRGNASRSAEGAQLTKDVTSTFSTLSNTLAGIKDVDSADAALPELTDLDNKLDGMQALMDKLPAGAKTKVAALVKPGLDKLSASLNRVLMIPVVGEKLRPTLESIVGRLVQLGGLKPDEFSLPSSEVTNVGSSLSSVLKSLTESFTGVTDEASAEAALPKLQELSGQLDQTTTDWETLSPASKATISPFIKSSLTTLTELVNKVLAMANLNDQFKGVADEILRNLMKLGS